MSTAFRLGAFVLFGLLVFAGVVFWVGNKQFVFTPTFRVYAEFDNAAGLTSGSQVRVGGVPQGTVKNIELPKRSDGKVRIGMDLNNQTHAIVKKDSVASIQSEGLVGDKYVEISFGTVETAHVNDGDTIGTDAPVQISDLIKKADGLLSNAKTAMETIEQTGRNIASITGKIDKGHGTAGALINDRKIYDQAGAAVTALKEDAEAMKHNFFLKGFFKNRGYQDSSEVGKHQIANIPDEDPSKAFQYDARKIFDKPDTAKIKNGKLMSDAGNYLAKNPFGLVVIICRGDGKGDSEKTQKLTEARAFTVRSYLVENFAFDDKRVVTMGQGKAPDASEGGDVSILIFPEGTKKPPSGAAVQGQAPKSTPKS
jgi:outer membrane protein OmpA-like peptidoglycan-associated protein